MDPDAQRLDRRMRIPSPRRRRGYRTLLVGGGVLAALGVAWLVASAARLPSTPAPIPSTPVPAGPLDGRVLDGESGTPIRAASILAGSIEARTDGDGRFSIGPLASGTAVLVRSPGYARERLLPDGSPLTIRLQPHVVKAAYLTYYGVNDREIRSRVLDLIERTELNAVVIDVKGDRGLIPYRTAVPLAVEVGAQGPVMIRDFYGLIADLKSRRVYTIARIVAFKDNILAHHRRDLAIIDTRTGQPWVDRERLAWVDPFQEEVWDYAIAVAKEAAAKGVDEIQFDYVRFPTDGRLSAARYSKTNDQASRLAAIGGFLAKARRELGPTGVFLAADLFGYTAFNENDTDIGQRIEDVAPHVDYISPMTYPSGYHLGIPGFRISVAHPYEIVRESVRLTRQRAGDANVRVRPWIQDFRDYAFDRRVFGVREVQAQVRGAEEAGASGWMLWNPGNNYTGDALRSDPTVVVRAVP